MSSTNLYRWYHQFPSRELNAWETRLNADPERTFIFSASPGQVEVTVEAWCTERSDAEAIRAEFGGRIKEVPDQNWAAVDGSASRKRIIRIRDRMVVTLDDDPEFLAELREKWPDRHLLIFPPDMAFGTGDHGTTSTVLRFLADLSRKLSPGWSLLDLGTGTGILAIAAHQLGAGPTLATDYDGRALEVAEDALTRHQIPAGAIELREEDVLEWTPSRTWDVVAANIFSTVLVQIMPKLRKSLNPNGTLLLSGILKRQRDEVVGALEKAGMSLVREGHAGKWVTLQAQISGSD